MNQVFFKQITWVLHNGICPTLSLLKCFHWPQACCMSSWYRINNFRLVHISLQFRRPLLTCISHLFLWIINACYNFGMRSYIINSVVEPLKISFGAPCLKFSEFIVINILVVLDHINHHSCITEENPQYLIFEGWGLAIFWSYKPNSCEFVFPFCAK